MLTVGFVSNNGVLYIEVGKEKGISISEEDLKRILDSQYSARTRVLIELLNNYPDEKIGKDEKLSLQKDANSSKSIEIILVDTFENGKHFQVSKKDEVYFLQCDTNEEKNVGENYETLDELFKDLQENYGYLQDESQKLRRKIDGIIS